MNIKSLLIGSAAALVAVSGARAADAIVAAEPEPVEYVRVCDAFGTGFFYIPGTETCLKIDGYVRFRVTATRGTAGYVQNTRARVNFDARSETELGTLRGYIRFQSNSGNVNGDANVVQDQAVLQLGGLWMGYTESAWEALWGGGVGNWGIIQTDNGGQYGYQQRQQIGYRYDSGAFYAGLTLEHDATADWTPDVVGVLGMTQGWGGAAVHVGYDETANAVGVKGMLEVAVAATGGSLRVGGFYSNRFNNAYGAAFPGRPAGSAEVANWSAGIGYTQDVTETLNATLGYQYFDGFSAANGGTFRNAHLIEGALSWTPVTNFNVRLEGNWGQTTSIAGVKTNTASGFVWFRRSF
ncbi:porin-like protein [Hoeflea halophila]|uniref:Porin n=1 Tax=Hoeflea halophila TaxID=714899 RepID=A0A286HP11_9HYPH|nr:porin [Hoeflea halophila]SOE08894.1 porin-like protein [Hoeflea halophila]